MYESSVSCYLITVCASDSLVCVTSRTIEQITVIFLLLFVGERLQFYNRKNRFMQYFVLTIETVPFSCFMCDSALSRRQSRSSTIQVSARSESKSSGSGVVRALRPSATHVLEKDSKNVEILVSYIVRWFMAYILCQYVVNPMPVTICGVQ